MTADPTPSPSDTLLLTLSPGLPSPKFFPFETLSSLTLDPATYAPAGVSPPLPKNWLSKLFASSLKFIETPKYAKAGELQLATALQYGGGGGAAELIAFLKQWTQVSASSVEEGEGDELIRLRASSTSALTASTGWTFALAAHCPSCIL